MDRNDTSPRWSVGCGPCASVFASITESLSLLLSLSFNELFVFQFGNNNYRYRYRLSTFSAVIVPTLSEFRYPTLTSEPNRVARVVFYLGLFIYLWLKSKAFLILPNVYVLPSIDQTLSLLFVWFFSGVFASLLLLSPYIPASPLILFIFTIRAGSGVKPQI